MKEVDVGFGLEPACRSRFSMLVQKESRTVGKMLVWDSVYCSSRCFLLATSVQLATMDRQGEAYVI